MPEDEMMAQLAEHLQNGADWEKLATPIPGVFVVKIPATKSRGARLMIEVNPVDESGNPRKRKGLFLTDEKMRRDFVVALENEDVSQLIRVVDSVNPSQAEAGKKKVLKMKTSGPQNMDDLE
ncbi:MAG TPA: hypothetical protein VKK79_24635 [Candidatus Lokiarchaeia archaeon]|nr:hypothetical protein [Candidatus Lokiarchaeia archaeon]